MTAPLLSAGVAVEEITPAAPVRMSGFAGRGGPSTGVRDSLRASALYLDDGAIQAVILTLDVIGLSPRDDVRLRRQMAAALDLRADSVLAACSHTHAGPASMTICGTGAKEIAWTEHLFERCVHAALRARSSAQPVTAARAGSVPCPAAINRRVRREGRMVIGNNPDGPLDPDCRVLVLDSRAGPVATLFHYAMHPVVLGSTNRQLSADWVGAARRGIEAGLGCPALFLQGCCGDINPRLRETDTPDAVEQVGGAVAKAALAAAHRARPITVTPLRCGEAQVKIPATPLPTCEALGALEQGAAQRARDRSLTPGARDLARAERRWARSQRHHQGRGALRSDIPARVSTLSLGEVTLVALPGEIFTEIGSGIRDVIPGSWPVGYAAGNIGYLYPDRALDEGGYEVEVAYRLYGTLQAGAGTHSALIVGAQKAARS